MSFNDEPEVVEIDHWVFVRKTTKAILIREPEDGTGKRVREEWIPKSQLEDGSDYVDDKQEGDNLIIVIPEWLAFEKEML
jgi:hypothetical protein